MGANGPMPHIALGYQYGASTAREEAMLKGMNAGYEQAAMNKKHLGGSKMTVPQFHTGASGDAAINSHMASLNASLTEHRANSVFDKLAITNSVGGGRKKRRTNKKKKTHKKKKTINRRR